MPGFTSAPESLANACGVSLGAWGLLVFGWGFFGGTASPFPVVKSHVPSWLYV